MSLGERLKQARLEAGFSQRQLCGEEITRNMLSQIENGSARPSMATLKYLAERLGKPVSFFLEEDAVVSPNREVMARARAAYVRRDFEDVVRALEEFREPDEVYTWERKFMELLTILELAEKAIAENRAIYARELLERAEETTASENFPVPELERRRLLLLLSLRPEEQEKLMARLPSIDRELCIRASAALVQEDPERAARLLDAAEDQKASDWGLLRGRTHVKQKNYREAIRCLSLAEDAYPRETALLLERCYRELGDYRQAYNYACKTRSFL